MKIWRIKQLVKNIDKDDIIADIGTDHAFIPIYLSKNKLAKKIYASDNKLGPLQLAKKNIDNSNINNVELMLGEGVQPYLKIPINTFIIAGMGGGTISEILNFVKSEKLILEPRNDFSLLRKTLMKKNYKIIDEQFVKNKGINHLFITTVYAQNERTNIVTNEDILIGPILKKENNDDYNLYINELYEKSKNLFKISKNIKFKNIIKIIEEWKK